MTTEPATGGGPVAEQLAGMPGVWGRLIDAHVPDRLGRCTACRSAGGAGVLWPCTLRAVALEARRLHGLLPGGPGIDGQEAGGAA